MNELYGSCKFVDGTLIVIRNESNRIALIRCRSKASAQDFCSFSATIYKRWPPAATHFSSCLVALFCFAIAVAVAVVPAMLREFHLDVIANVFQDQRWQL